MPRTHASRKPFIFLVRWSSAGGVRWHIASLAAGWLALFVSPPQNHRGERAAKSVLLGAAILLVALLALGPVLAALQPVLTEAGRLDGGTLVLVFLAVLNLWRWRVGRAVLIALASTITAPQPRSAA